MFFLGMVTMLVLLPGFIDIGGRFVDLHVMVFGSLLAILGFQIIVLGVYARIYAVTHKFIPQGYFLKRMFKIFNLERGLAMGAGIFFIGFCLGIYIFIKWIQNQFGLFNELRFALFASTLMIIGTQIIFSSFFLSMLGIERK